ncbi:hypothetical protein N656DRAFT_772209 [Canariomyces notabilis]|uniref:Uncharacterized protein n=1 Tax=Canariomyces notabilis TaxID=2074819 RepID=A0AAN6T7G4_9PEZI|nr:hypothetical protein N656DRAFT_772209 [Canariomyces arenarius]
MAREGTRSQTGNSKPRVFPVIDTAPAVKRTTKPKAAKKKATSKTEAKGAKPAGVTKKQAPAKESGAAKKVFEPQIRLMAGNPGSDGFALMSPYPQVKAAVKKTTKKVAAGEKKVENAVEKAEKPEKADKAEKPEKEAKPKTATKKKEAPAAK